MAVYKQFNTNEVVVSPFKANKRFRFGNNQVSSSDVQIEYYQSQQGRYLSGSFDTGFNTMQDGVNVFHSIKQLYYSNYLTSSWGDPISTASLVPGPVGPQGQNLGFDQFVGNVTGPNFDNFLQSSLTQDRKFAQFSASIAPIGYAGTDTNVSESFVVNYLSTPNDININFNAGQPDLLSAGINETYVLSTATWKGLIQNSPFVSALGSIKLSQQINANNTDLVFVSGTANQQAIINLNDYPNTGIGVDGVVAIGWNGTEVNILAGSNIGGSNYKSGDIITIDATGLNGDQSIAVFAGNTTFTIDAAFLNLSNVLTVNASQLVEERINPDVFIVANTPLGRGLTLKPNSDNIFQAAIGAGTISLNYLLAPRGPSVISIPSMLFGERIQPSSFQFEYTSSINFTRSIVDDDGQGNLIVTQSNAAGVPFFSGSVGQIFYSQGIAAITGPDSGSLREFAHNVGYKDNMNPNIMSSSLSYSSSITIDENQYKCSVRDNEFLFTTNPSSLGISGELTQTNNQLLKSFDPGAMLNLSDNTYNGIKPRNIVGDVKATTFYIFGDRASTTTIGGQYVIELTSAGGTTLEFIGWDQNGNGRRNGSGQVQFNSTGSAVGMARGFCDAINSVGGFNGSISASLQNTNTGLDTVMLTQIQAGSVGNTFLKYTDSFNLLLAENTYASIPKRGQVRFGNTYIVGSGIPQPVDGTDIYQSTKGAILNIVVAGGNVTNINISSSTSGQGYPQSFMGSGYAVGDRLEILGTDLGGTEEGFITLTAGDVEKEGNTQIYHDFVTGSYFSPYVTTVGLYNASNELVVVGKFPRPLPISLQTDTTYIINFDTN